MESKDFKLKKMNDFYFSEIKEILVTNMKLIEEKSKVISLTEEEKLNLKSLKMSVIYCLYHISSAQQFQYSFLTSILVELLPFIYKLTV